MQIYMLYKLGYSVQEIVMVCVINMVKHQLYTRITTCKQIIVYTQLRVELVAKCTGDKYSYCITFNFNIKTCIFAV